MILFVSIFIFRDSRDLSSEWFMPKDVRNLIEVDSAKLSRHGTSYGKEIVIV